MSIRDTIYTLKNKEATLTNNKVCNFAYDDTAFADDTSAGANGVINYNYNNHNNIPVKDNSVLKVNPTITAKGFRSQVSTLPRMLMNHIFGRVSYNLNKTVDVLNSLLTNLYNAIGQANGIATLDETGRVPYSQLPLSAVEYKGAWNASTNTPSLSAGTGTYGDKYIVSVSGTQNLGEGSITYVAGDQIIYNGSIWQRIPAGTVRKINNILPNNSGNVTLNANNILTPDVYGYDTKSAGKTWETVDKSNRAYYALAEENGFFVTASSEAGSYLMWSTDGVEWDDCTGTLERGSISTKIKYRAGQWYATLGYHLYTSTNGKDWSLVSSTSSLVIRDFDFANGLCVAVTESGILWSDDLSTWTRGTDDSVDGWGVVYANGIWLVNTSGAQTKMYHLLWADDGKVWHTCTGYPTDVGTNYARAFRTPVFNNGVWLVSSDKGTSDSINGVWKSTDGKAWTKPAMSVGGSNFNYVNANIIFAEGRWLVTSALWRTFSSEDGSSWTSIENTQGTEYITKLVYGNGLFIGIRNDTTLYWSSDLLTASYPYWHSATTAYEHVRGILYSDKAKTWVLVDKRNIKYSKGSASNNVADILNWLLQEAQDNNVSNMSNLYVHQPVTSGDLQDGFLLRSMWGNQLYRTLMVSVGELTVGTNHVMFLQDTISPTSPNYIWGACKLATVEVAVVSESGACGGQVYAVTYNNETKNYVYQSQEWVS